MRLKLLVTGTGRCGTAFACQVLRSAGLECGHESIFGASMTLPGVPRYVNALGEEFDADSSWLAAPWLSHPCLANVRVIHQVRHPVRVMESFIQQGMYREDTPCTRFLERHLPQVRLHEDFRVRAMVHWILWNQMITSSCPRAIVHRVEDGIEAFLARAGVEDWRRPVYDNTSLNSGPNRVEHPDIDNYPDGEWKERLVAYAEKLGYYLEDLP